MKSICHKLQSASDKGLLNDKQNLMGILEFVSQNLHVNKKWKAEQSTGEAFPGSYHALG